MSANRVNPGFWSAQSGPAALVVAYANRIRAKAFPLIRAAPRASG
ncbi:hypothetical protein MT49_0171 [Mycobacterium tuberculosis 49-02]|nr:hypothetical protein MT49_0171 [Mycobacterium tuberculosis 49-02]